MHRLVGYRPIEFMSELMILLIDLSHWLIDFAALLRNILSVETIPRVV